LKKTNPKSILVGREARMEGFSADVNLSYSNSFLKINMILIITYASKSILDASDMKPNMHNQI